MKKNMLLAVLLATFFSCTEVLDELNTIGIDPDVVVDSLGNIVGKDSTIVGDSTIVEDSLIVDEDSLIEEEPGVLQTGLFASNLEIEAWKKRLEVGPFKTTNDIGTNSPGGYERIIRNANSFLTNPSEDRVQWPNKPLEWGSFEPRASHIKLRDAAFVYSITNNMRYAEAVKSELLAQSKEPSCDFKNSTTFSARVTTQNPWFDIAAWLTRLLYAYDLVEDTFSDAEKAHMERWFLQGAELFRASIDSNFKNLWPNRASGNYTPSDRAKKFSTYTHHNGYKVYLANRWYNNRAASEVMFYGLTGVKFGNMTLINSAKRWFKEYITYGIYPSGIPAEFHRTYDQPDRDEAGYDYSSITADCMINLADALARTGDFELYNFQTSDGFAESKGGNKSLLLVLQTLSNLMYDQYYDPKTKSNYIYSGSNHNISTKIDGRRSDDVFARPIWFAHANLYYNDPVISNTYNKIINENLKYNNVGGLKPFGGAWDVLPGKLFMWGNLEGTVNPYVISTF